MAELSEQENNPEQVQEHQDKLPKNKTIILLTALGGVFVFVLITGILAFIIIQIQEQNTHIEQQNVTLEKIGASQDALNLLLGREVQTLAEKIQNLSQIIAEIPPPAENDENDITRDDLQSLTQYLTKEITDQIDELKTQTDNLSEDINDLAEETKNNIHNNRRSQSESEEYEKQDDERIYDADYKSWWQRLLGAFRISRITSPESEAEAQ